MERTPITIKKDGKWYFGEAEMFRRDIVNHLAVNTFRHEDGSYYIRIGEEVNPLIVEDVPFFAIVYEEQEDGKVKLIFHDMQEFIIESPVKITLNGDTPYISYKWENDTKLSRGVYWGLSKHFQIDNEEVCIVPPNK